MIYLKGHLSRPLDAVLTAPSRLAVLRALFRAKSPLSGRALARLAGINHQGAAVALAGLARLGLVERRPAGRSDQWRLDRRGWLMSELLLPLLEREAEHAGAVVDAIRKGLRGKAAAAFVAGAAAKGRLEAGKPVQLVVVEGAGGRRPMGGPGGGPGHMMFMQAPAAKSKDFRGSFRRLLGELRPERLLLVAVLALVVSGNVVFLYAFAFFIGFSALWMQANPARTAV